MSPALALLGLALLPQGTDLPRRVPSAVPGPVQEEVDRFDPTLDGWGSEVLAQDLKVWGKELASHLLGKGPLPGGVGTWGLAVDLTKLEQGAEGSLVWKRWRGQGTPAEHEALLELVEPCVGGAASVKVISLVPSSPDRGEQEARLRVELRGPMRRAQAVLEVALITSEREGSVVVRDPTLVALDVVVAPSPSFIDRGVSWIASSRARATLQPSLAGLRARLDRRLGVGLLGHHGLALGDLEGDGLEEVLVCQPGGVPNLLLQRDEDGAWVDRARPLGLDHLDASRSALILDLDGDGASEVLLGTADGVVLLAGRPFRSVANLGGGEVTSLAAADVDGNGLLDLFACGYLSPYEGAGVPMPYHDARNGAPNTLWLQTRPLEFEDRTDSLGLDADNERFSFAAVFEDLDGDQDPDLYVVNDFGANQLWWNEGDGFAEGAAKAGLEDVAAGMGVSLSDVDGDGDFDLYVSNMFSSAGGRIVDQEPFLGEAAGDLLQVMRRHAKGNSLFLSGPEQTFREVPDAGGARMGRWAWGARFQDLDNDGDEDIHCPAGFVTGPEPDDL